ncbi:MAG: LysR substrate-binding domain-containing protein [Pseudomonadota bacterium]
MRHFTPLRYIDEVAKAGSIRRAAEALAITPSALNRRILSIEEELGAQIFERIPGGVRLNTAGEYLVHYIRQQNSDLERVLSQIADLSGMRRGHISIACSQALLPHFITREINRYRAEHPAVTFTVLLRDREGAEEVLHNYSADIALVFEPPRIGEFRTIVRVRQPVYAVMARDHPLAASEIVRLADCLGYPTALPLNRYGVRYLFDAAVHRIGLPVEPIVQSDSFEFLVNYAATMDAITYQIPIGLSADSTTSNVVGRPVDTRDIPAGLLYLVQLKTRTLSVAAARFADQLVNTFVSEFDSDST